VLAVGNCCYVDVYSATQGALAPTGEERGGGILWRPPAYRLLHLIVSNTLVCVIFELHFTDTSLTCIYCDFCNSVFKKIIFQNF